jgi:hypothetical protein
MGKYVGWNCRADCLRPRPSECYALLESELAALGNRSSGELFVGSGAAEVLQLGEETLDQVALAIEVLFEAGLPAPVFGGMLGVTPWSWINSRMRPEACDLSASTMVRGSR